MNPRFRARKKKETFRWRGSMDNEGGTPSPPMAVPAGGQNSGRNDIIVVIRVCL